MPLLDRNGLKQDVYVRVGRGALSEPTHALVDWADLPVVLAERGRHQRIGVEVPNSIGAAALRLLLDEVALMVIAFPSFSDGRGFSLARQMRSDGFAGVLRAHGPLMADQFPQAIACGFDEIELPDDTLTRQPVADWLKALVEITHGYQRSYGDGAAIPDLRRTGAARVRK